MAANNPPLPQGTTSGNPTVTNAAAAQEIAASTPLRHRPPTITEGSETTPSPNVCATSLIRLTSSEQIDRDPFGERLRIGARLKHLYELEIFGRDPDLIYQRLADRMIVIDQRPQDFRQISKRQAG